MKPTTPLAAATLLAALLPAQVKQGATPPFCVGFQHNGMHWALYSYVSGMTQELVDEASFGVPKGGLIVSTGFRRQHYEWWKAAPGYQVEMHLAFSHAPFPHGSIDRDPKKNRGADYTVVVPRQKASLPPYVGDGVANKTGPVFMRHVLAQPFLYKGGTFMWELQGFEAPPPPPAKALYFDINPANIPHREGTAHYSTWGLACPSPLLNRNVASTANEWVPGGNLVLKLDYASFLGTQALALVGPDADQWSGLPLPLELGPLGMPGCRLYVGPFLAVPVPVSLSSRAVEVKIPLPGDPGLEAAFFRSQWVVVDPKANAAGLAFSNAASHRLQQRLSAVSYGCPVYGSFGWTDDTSLYNGDLNWFAKSSVHVSEWWYQ